MKTRLACALFLLNMFPCIGETVLCASSEASEERVSGGYEKVGRRVKKKKPKKPSNNSQENNEEEVPYSFYYPYQYSFYYPETDGDDEEDTEECHSSYQDGNIFFECN